MEILGIDVGGSGIKGAPVNAESGDMLADRYRLVTPEGAKPQEVADTIASLVEYFQWKGQVGVGFPAAVRNGNILTAANIDKSWIGVNAETLFNKRTGCTFHVANDADVAGFAEIAFGAAKDVKGVVLMLTLGTGLGTAIFVNGQLVPNTELGHIEIRGKEAEVRAADSARVRKGWTYEEWGKRLDEYIGRMEALFWPDLIVIGGGVSKYADKFFPYLHPKTRMVQAKLLNQAGIVGAAAFAKSFL
jgi:polyphosphate glucokinase